MITHQPTHHILRFNLVPCTQLPHPRYRFHRTHQIQQNIHLMNGLINQCAAAFNVPSSPLLAVNNIHRSGTTSHKRPPCNSFPRRPAVKRPLQKNCCIIKPVLAHHAQLDPRLPRHIENLSRCFKIRRYRLLHLDRPASPPRSFHRFQMRIRKRAHIHKIQPRHLAHLACIRYELRVPTLCKVLTACRCFVRTRHQFKADVLIRLGVFVGNRAGAHESQLASLKPRLRRRR